MLKVFETVFGVKVFVEQDHPTHAPRLGMRTKHNVLQVDAILTTEETEELIETLLKTMPPYSANDLTSRLNSSMFARAERARNRRLKRPIEVEATDAPVHSSISAETEDLKDAQSQAWLWAASFGTMPGMTWPETLRYHATQWMSKENNVR